MAKEGLQHLSFENKVTRRARLPDSTSESSESGRLNR